MRQFGDLLLVGVGVAVILLCAGLRDRSGASAETKSLPPGYAATAQDAPVAQAVGAGEIMRSPAACAREIHRLRTEGRFQELTPYLIEDRPGTAAELLAQVDRVLAANRRLHQAADRAFGAMAGVRWDLSAMEDNLGLFSTHVKFISERFKGDRALVTVQQGDHVPLHHAEFELHGDRWLLRVPRVPLQMAAELDRLAEELEAIAQRIDAGGPPEYYAAVFFDQIIPQMKRVALANDSPETVAGLPSE